ncbi:hypothetical protein [Streptosporangium sp. NBC_01756]|uniref:hypothetical protein n=1 Tax=Streptosporangium sp. NBC_01756 TaxID=2975950 RepID=UPI002DD9C61F|nr:hypothetical protein [Streptosporangium sp. NBC_01756]WSC85799.1 hypothetical protein OIE48_36430 [Streptosporangium sp. NBC_01756]
MSLGPVPQTTSGHLADEEIVQDAAHRRVVRLGDTVRRPAHGLASAAGLIDAVIGVQQDGIEQVRRLIQARRSDATAPVLIR